ncbi:MAG: signal peptidase I [Actinomycetota bacterium]
MNLDADRAARLRHRGTLIGVPVATAYVCATIVLGLWVLTPVLLSGWSPVVVTSGSMQPAISPGDVVLLEELAPGDVAVEGEVITFVDPLDDGTTITHRVLGLDDRGHYITRGDANLDADGVAVPPDQVIGVGRLLIPVVGLPVVWLERGHALLFFAWAISLAGLIAMLSSNLLRRRRRAAGPVASDVADAAIRRLRNVVCLLVLAQLAADPDVFGASLIDPLLLAGAAIAVFGGLNVLSRVRPDTPRRAHFELVADGALAVLIAAPAGSGSLLWILLSLPIAEAAARYRIVGAVSAWIVVALSTIAVRVASSDDAGAVVSELDSLLDQLGILLLITLPGAFLAEQLLVDIARQRKAELAAVERGELLHVVAEAGQRVSTVEMELMSTVTDTAVALGFDRADVVVNLDDEWIVVAVSPSTRSLPEPETSAGAVVGRRLPLRNEIDDADAHAAPALRALGLGQVISFRLSTDPVAAVRVGVAAGRPATGEQLEAAELLVGQARVALENELLVAELRLAREALEEQALTDALTGLPNRAGFHRYLDGRPHDEDMIAGVLFCDLDGFKAVNDELGHDAGDALLVEIAGRLAGLTEEQDLVARLGGDEFVVVAIRHDTRALEQLAQSIVDAVGVPVELGNDVAVVGTSVGLAESAPGVEDDELVRRADAAMYSVKAAGKRSWRRFDESLEAVPRRSVQLRNDIRTAAAAGQLVLEYQPIVAASPGPLRVLLAEALLRWQHPELGRIGPLDTLAAADDAGVRDEIEEWALRTACAAAAAWQVPSGPPVPVAVNLSPGQLERRELVQLIATSLAGTGLPPECLVLELSERAAIDRPEVLARLEELRGRGVSLALDDFGTGEASLTSLRRVSLDILKLDKSFVDRCESVETERKILASVASLAQGLGLIVVAEGVERPQQLAIVRDCDIELVQGHLAHRPLPLERFLDVLARQRRAAAKQQERNDVSS